jgi:DNA-binding NtrC family response regulator
VAATTILWVGRGGLPAGLKAHCKRRGYRVRSVSDCGNALETLRDLEPRAVVLDVAGAGFAAAAFREMLRADSPSIVLFEVPGLPMSPEDVGLFTAELDRALEGGAPSLEGEREPGRTADERAEPAFDAGVSGYKFEDLTSRSPRMIELFGLIERVAKTDSPVLIHGETGTGKELVAAAIHRNSPRRDGPFFTVNCGALTDTLLESELFGHERGAFTGAYRRKEGCFELAHEGTLFLDELGTVSTAMQVKLLRVLERMEVRRVGGAELVKVDVRILAATNARLEDAVAAGTFREDLYYRLNVVQLALPPLRERPEDIPVLADLFRRKFAEKQRREVVGFERGAERVLVEYPWPGNVRELQNVVERAVIMAGGPRIQERDLPERLRRQAARKPSVPSFDAEDTLSAVLRRLETAVEREYLRRVLRKYQGHLGRTADHAGLNRRTLYNKMHSHNLRKDEFRAQS